MGYHSFEVNFWEIYNGAMSDNHLQNITDVSRSRASVTMGHVKKHGRPPGVTATLVTTAANVVCVVSLLALVNCRMPRSLFTSKYCRHDGIPGDQ